MEVCPERGWRQGKEKGRDDPSEHCRAVGPDEGRPDARGNQRPADLDAPPGAVFAAGKPTESPARARAVRKPGSDQPIPVTLFDGEVDAVDTYAAAGVGRVLFFVRPLGTVEMTGLVDQIALRLGNRLK